MCDPVFLSPQLINTYNLNILSCMEENNRKLKLQQDSIQIKNKNANNIEQTIILIGIDNTDKKDKISHTAYQDHNDLTIEQLGNFDSSLILSSKGTGDDAIKLITEAEV